MLIVFLELLSRFDSPCLQCKYNEYELIIVSCHTKHELVLTFGSFFRKRGQEDMDSVDVP